MLIRQLSLPDSPSQSSMSSPPMRATSHPACRPSSDLHKMGPFMESIETYIDPNEIHRSRKWFFQRDEYGSKYCTFGLPSCLPFHCSPYQCMFPNCLRGARARGFLGVALMLHTGENMSPGLAPSQGSRRCGLRRSRAYL